MKGVLGVLIGLSMILSSVLAHAIPVVSVDMDPLTAGVQSEAEVVVGSTITVDIVVSGLVDNPLNPFDGLNAFEFDLDFDPSILSATGVVSGGFLPAIILPPTIVESNIAEPDVNFAEAAFGLFGSFGSGVLATITFDVIGVGGATLDLNDVILSAPFGTPITSITSNGSITATPEPASLLLVSSGIVGVAGWEWRRQKANET